MKAGREQARRGTIDSHNLLKRLKERKDSVLLFMRYFSVPFTNNLSEQDLRMNKVKQKISGLFKSKEGGDNFCKIRSVLSTGRKNKRNIFQILQEAFQNSYKMLRKGQYADAANMAVYEQFYALAV